MKIIGCSQNKYVDAIGKRCFGGAGHAKTSPKSVDEFFHGVKNILVLSLKDCPFSEVTGAPVTYRYDCL